ncbi:hypothetical protein FXO38_01210 [Capsicum annuum]|nr:hypothetical protein FXO38_01210 [Capsicum annuum]KAF3684842.1 hypothetical protein FXO37_01153 [Capsicum annuum]
MKTLSGLKLVTSLVLGICEFLILDVECQDDDASVMLILKKSLNPPQEISWLDPDPRKWNHVGCSDKRVIRIQIGHQNIQGMLNVANFECPDICLSAQILEFEERDKNRSRTHSLKGLNVGDAKNLSHEDLKKITNNFSDPIGRVGHALLFRRFMDDGQEVTVKT